MSIPSGHDAALTWAQIEPLFIHTARWHVHDREPDGAGGWTEGWVDLGPVHCMRTQPGGLGDREHLVADQTQVRISVVVYLRPDSGVEAGDRLIFDEYGREETFRVEAVVRPYWLIYWRAECSTVQTQRADAA